MWHELMFDRFYFLVAPVQVYLLSEQEQYPCDNYDTSY
jgi:hypothetical protein